MTKTRHGDGYGGYRPVKDLQAVMVRHETINQRVFHRRFDKTRVTRILHRAGADVKRSTLIRPRRVSFDSDGSCFPTIGRSGLR